MKSLFIALGLIFSIGTLFISGLASSPPIVLVPGLAGSVLEAKLDRSFAPHFICTLKSDWFTIWVALTELMTPEVCDCFTDNLRLLWDAETNSYTNQTGVDILPVDFGGLGGIKYLDPSLETSQLAYYENLITALSTLGYKENLNLFGAPYDWRLGPPELTSYFQDLQQLVETSAASNGGEKTVLIAHSLGCLLTHYFLTMFASPEWVSTYIAAFIPLDGPFLGASVSAKAMISGNNLDIPLVSPLTFRPIQRSGSSSLWLLPHPAWSADLPIVQIGSDIYAGDEFMNLFESLVPTDSTFESAVTNYARANVTVAALAQQPPLVPTLCIYGVNVPTPESFIWADSNINVEPKTTNGNGDGTVNYESLRVCKQWAESTDVPIQTVELNNVTHVGVLKDQTMISTVLQYLSNL